MGAAHACMEAAVACFAPDAAQAHAMDAKLLPGGDAGGLEPQGSFAPLVLCKFSPEGVAATQLVRSCTGKHDVVGVAAVLHEEGHLKRAALHLCMYAPVSAHLARPGHRQSVAGIPGETFQTSYY